MVEPVAIASDPSGPGPNEDTAGSAGNARRGAAWVIDGCTDVAGRTFVPGEPSDAAWYARTLEAAFEDLWDGSPGAVARAAIGRAAAAWSAAVGAVEVPRYGLPSAAAVWATWSDDRLTVAGLGDCTAILRPDGGPARSLGRHGITVSEAALNAAVRRLQQSGVEDPAQRRSALADRLRTARARMNAPAATGSSRSTRPRPTTSTRSRSGWRAAATCCSPPTGSGGWSTPTACSRPTR
ncbi:MAG: hypothetical protein ACK5WM_19585 [Rhodospirillales bacterium]